MNTIRSKHLRDNNLENAIWAKEQRDVLDILYNLNITNTNNPHTAGIGLRFWVRHAIFITISNERRKTVKNR